jgi:hypothetical protein
VPETSELAPHFTLAPPREKYPYLRRVDVPSSYDGIAHAYAVTRLDGGQRKRARSAPHVIGRLTISNPVMVGCFQAGGPDGFPEKMQDFVGFAERVHTAASKEPPYPGIDNAIQALSTTYPDAQFAKLRVSGLYHVRYDSQSPAALPANFATCGDAGLRLNPIFGQVRSMPCMFLALRPSCVPRDARRQQWRRHALTLPSAGCPHPAAPYRQDSRTKP